VEEVVAGLWPEIVRQVGAREDGVNTLERERRRRVNAADPRMRVRAAEEGGVEHPRADDVRDVPAFAGEELRVLGAEHPSADPGDW
jgi:hypothetical protein